MRVFIFVVLFLFVFIFSERWVRLNCQNLAKTKQNKTKQSLLMEIPDTRDDRQNGHQGSDRKTKKYVGKQRASKKENVFAIVLKSDF